MTGDMLSRLKRADQALYEWVGRRHTPAVDRPLRALSRMADKSLLWMGVAAVVAAGGGARGRRAALHGLVSIGVTSALVNAVLKPLYRRRRPTRATAASSARHVPIPGSSSFPSGHAASAAAFANAVGRGLPALAIPVGALAAAVAYSRVHTGVHYPGDVIAGSVVGTVFGRLVPRVAERRRVAGTSPGAQAPGDTSVPCGVASQGAPTSPATA